MAFGMKNILQGGLAANYSEQSPEELAKEYGMYRQNYCGCMFSYEEMQEREKRAKIGSKKKVV